MHQINTTTKKFTEAVTIDLGQLPTVDTRLDFILTDGTNPVIAENKTFAMTIGSVLGSLYKTDEDTVSFRYLKFNDDNIADSLVITMTMDGVEILNDTVSLKYQRECIDKGALEEAINAKADKATTIAGYGITDAYTKTEVDAKVSSVYRYRGTVSTYADLPSSGQEVGDVYNIETADSTHGIKAGDNVAWNGSVWDALSGAVDLTPFALKAEAGTDHNHDGVYIPVTGCPLTNFSVEGKRADGSSVGKERIRYWVEDRTDHPVDNLDIKTQRLRLNSNEVTFIAKPTLDGRAANQAGGFVISDYYTGDIKAPGELIEGDTKLSDKYATKSHTHAMGDITGLPASGGTAGQVLTKTDTGSEWDDLPDTTDYLCFTATQAGSTVGMVKNGTPPTINLEYSTDKKHWTEYTWSDNTGATITLANIGDNVWWRGNNTAFSIDITSSYRFTMSGSIEASGNIMSLLDKTCKSVTIPTAYCFTCLFSLCSSLTTAPKLPATTLAEHCYYWMFNGCSSLREAPELPATTLAENCYNYMFHGCTSLTKAPELPATTMVNGCYQQMFQGCKSLTKAPELPATTLAENCYYGMFKGCSKINKVKVPFTMWGNTSTINWLYGASATGVLECPSALDCSTRDTSHVPAGWTIVRTDSPKSITSPTSASSEATYQVSPNAPSVPVVTVASALTLNASTVDSGSVAYTEIVLDVATGATVTAGNNLTLVDTPEVGKRNICVVRWSNGVAKLYVTIVEDLPQA